MILHEQWSREQLKQLRKDEHFTCPQCHQTVQLKVGAINVPHFSHRRDEACEQLFSEGESLTHLQGKLDLYHLLQTDPRLTVQLEPYLRELHQRPDLLLEQDNLRTPLEFQVSRIPTEDLNKRTARYKAYSMEPLWILFTPRKIISLTEGPTICSLNSFERQFLQHLTTQPYLLTYHPETKHFHYVSSLLHIEKNTYIVNHRKLPLAMQQYPLAVPRRLSPNDLTQYLRLFNRRRTQYIQSAQLYNRQGIQHVFLRCCYELRMTPSALPAWIGVPVAFDDGFVVHPCEWQIAFLHYLRISGKNCQEKRQQSIYQQFIQRYDPGNAKMISSVRKYHLFLGQIGFTKENGIPKLTEQEKYTDILSEYLQK